MKLQQAGEQASASRSSPGSQTLGDVANTLRSIVEDAEEFLTSFCGQLQEKLSGDQELDRYVGGSTTEAISDRNTSIQATSPASTDSTQQLELLAEAWLRLESEQRALMQQKKVDPRTERRDSPSLSRHSTTQGASSPPPSISSTIAQSSPLKDFEQLRREIRSNRANSGLHPR